MTSVSVFGREAPEEVHRRSSRLGGAGDPQAPAVPARMIASLFIGAGCHQALRSATKSGLTNRAVP